MARASRERPVKGTYAAAAAARMSDITRLFIVDLSVAKRVTGIREAKLLKKRGAMMQN